MTCAHCEKAPAICVGNYDENQYTPACGHGCEDGDWICVEVDEDGDWICSCGAEGSGEYFTHLKTHRDQGNIHIARQG